MTQRCTAAVRSLPLVLLVLLIANVEQALAVPCRYADPPPCVPLAASTTLSLENGDECSIGQAGTSIVENDFDLIAVMSGTATVYISGSVTLNVDYVILQDGTQLIFEGSGRGGRRQDSTSSIGGACAGVEAAPGGSNAAAGVGGRNPPPPHAKPGEAWWEAVTGDMELPAGEGGCEDPVAELGPSPWWLNSTGGAALRLAVKQDIILPIATPGVPFIVFNFDGCTATTGNATGGGAGGSVAVSARQFLYDNSDPSVPFPLISLRARGSDGAVNADSTGATVAGGGAGGFISFAVQEPIVWHTGDIDEWLLRKAFGGAGAALNSSTELAPWHGTPGIVVVHAPSQLPEVPDVAHIILPQANAAAFPSITPRPDDSSMPEFRRDLYLPHTTPTWTLHLRVQDANGVRVWNVQAPGKAVVQLQPWSSVEVADSGVAVFDPPVPAELVVQGGVEVHTNGTLHMNKGSLAADEGVRVASGGVIRTWNSASLAIGGPLVVAEGGTMVCQGTCDYSSSQSIAVLDGGTLLGSALGVMSLVNTVSSLHGGLGAPAMLSGLHGCITDDVAKAYHEAGTVSTGGESGGSGRVTTAEARIANQARSASGLTLEAPQVTISSTSAILLNGAGCNGTCGGGGAGALYIKGPTPVGAICDVSLQGLQAIGGAALGGCGGGGGSVTLDCVAAFPSTAALLVPASAATSDVFPCLRGGWSAPGVPNGGSGSLWMRVANESVTYMMASSKCSRVEDELDPLGLPVSPRPPPPGTALSFQHARTPHNSSHPDVTHTTRVHLFAGAVGVIIDGSYWDLGGEVSVEEGATLTMTKTAILRVNSIFVGGQVTCGASCSITANDTFTVRGSGIVSAVTAGSANLKPHEDPAFSGGSSWNGATGGHALAGAAAPSGYWLLATPPSYPFDMLKSDLLGQNGAGAAGASASVSGGGGFLHVAGGYLCHIEGLVHTNAQSAAYNSSSGGGAGGTLLIECGGEVLGDGTVSSAGADGSYVNVTGAGGAVVKKYQGGGGAGGSVVIHSQLGSTPWQRSIGGGLGRQHGSHGAVQHSKLYDSTTIFVGEPRDASDVHNVAAFVLLCVPKTELLGTVAYKVAHVDTVTLHSECLAANSKRQPDIITIMQGTTLFLQSQPTSAGATGYNVSTGAMTTNGAVFGGGEAAVFQGETTFVVYGVLHLPRGAQLSSGMLLLNEGSKLTSERSTPSWDLLNSGTHLVALRGFIVEDGATCDLPWATDVSAITAVIKGNVTCDGACAFQGQWFHVTATGVLRALAPVASQHKAPHPFAGGSTFACSTGGGGDVAGRCGPQGWWVPQDATSWESVGQRRQRALERFGECGAGGVGGSCAPGSVGGGYVHVNVVDDVVVLGAIHVDGQRAAVSNNADSGGAAGGVVILVGRASVSVSGRVTANGADSLGALGVGLGNGGGGAGGVIMAFSAALGDVTVDGLTAQANGGLGGVQHGSSGFLVVGGADETNIYSACNHCNAELAEQARERGSSNPAPLLLPCAPPNTGTSSVWLSLSGTTALLPQQGCSGLYGGSYVQLHGGAVLRLVKVPEPPPILPGIPGDLPTRLALASATAGTLKASNLYAASIGGTYTDSMLFVPQGGRLEASGSLTLAVGSVFVTSGGAAVRSQTLSVVHGRWAYPEGYLEEAANKDSGLVPPVEVQVEEDVLIQSALVHVSPGLRMVAGTNILIDGGAVIRAVAHSARDAIVNSSSCNAARVGVGGAHAGAGGNTRLCHAERPRAGFGSVLSANSAGAWSATAKARLAAADGLVASDWYGATSQQARLPDLPPGAGGGTIELVAQAAGMVSTSGGTLDASGVDGWKCNIEGGALPPGGGGAGGSIMLRGGSLQRHTGMDGRGPNLQVQGGSGGKRCADDNADASPQSPSGGGSGGYVLLFKYQADEPATRPGPESIPVDDLLSFSFFSMTTCARGGLSGDVMARLSNKALDNQPACMPMEELSSSMTAADMAAMGSGGVQLMYSIKGTYGHRVRMFLARPVTAVSIDGAARSGLIPGDIQDEAALAKALARLPTSTVGSGVAMTDLAPPLPSSFASPVVTLYTTGQPLSLSAGSAWPSALRCVSIAPTAGEVEVCAIVLSPGSSIAPPVVQYAVLAASNATTAHSVHSTKEVLEAAPATAVQETALVILPDASVARMAISLVFVEAPSLLTRVRNATIVLRATDGMWAYSSAASNQATPRRCSTCEQAQYWASWKQGVHAVEVNSTTGLISIQASNLPDGRHSVTVRVASTWRFGLVVEEEYAWEIASGAIVFAPEEVQPVAPDAEGEATGAQAVDRLRVVDGLPAQVWVSLPQAPAAAGEELVVACVSNDTVQGGSVEPGLLVLTAAVVTTPHALTVAAASTGEDNSDRPPTPWQIVCDAHSEAAEGVARVYSAAPNSVPTPTLLVTTVNKVVPVMGDVLIQVRDTSGGLVTISAVAGSPPSLVLTSSGGTRVTIVAAQQPRGPHWVAAVEPQVYESNRVYAPLVTVGGVAATNVTVSPDGRVLSFDTPAYSLLCPTPSACDGTDGYKGLVIDGMRPTLASLGSNGPQRRRRELAIGALGSPITSDTKVVVAASARFAYPAHVQTVACPPSCPGEGGSTGVYYTPTCTGYNSGPACLDAALATTCAFGAGDDCVQCPTGALCPGGYRVWSLPGYFVTAESTGVARRCSAPAKQRCVGWNATTRRTQCGAGYTGATSGCAACERGYFSDNGLCLRCPEGDVLRGIVLPLAFLAGACAAVFAAVWGVAVAILKLRHIPLVKGETVARLAVVQSAEFAVWTAVVLQSLVQVGKASVSLPSFLATMYSALTVFELSPSFVHIDCFVGGSPFKYPLVQLSVVLLALALFVLLGVVQSRRGSQRDAFQSMTHEAATRGTLQLEEAPESPSNAAVKPGRLSAVRRGLVTLLVLAYPMSCNQVLRLLHCRYVTGDEAHAGSSLDVESQWVVDQHPNMVCLSLPHHLPAAMVAAAVALFFVLGFPLCTMWRLHIHVARLWRRAMASGGSGGDGASAKQGRQLHTLLLHNAVAPRPRTREEADMQLVWGSFLYTSYVPQKFYFKQVNMLVLLVFGASVTFLARQSPLACMVVNMATMCLYALALLRGQPHAPNYAWELPVKVFSLVVTLMSSGMAYASTLDDNNSNSDSSSGHSPLIVVLAAVTFVMTLALAVVLVGAFLVHLLRMRRKPLQALSSSKPTPDSFSVANPMVGKQHERGDGAGAVGGSTLRPWKSNPLRATKRPVASVERASVDARSAIARQLAAVEAVQRTHKPRRKMSFRPLGGGGGGAGASASM